ncbi:hypothetical protein HMPREF9412_4178 [Paenibacillus sp. HGF5]|nr:hypothetical protein HMPREF9412_4178 [Paenibacillus sp. HGF5]
MSVGLVGAGSEQPDDSYEVHLPMDFEKLKHVFKESVHGRMTF